MELVETNVQGVMKLLETNIFFCTERLDSLGLFPSFASIGHKKVGAGRMVDSALQWIFLPQQQNV